MTQTDHLKLNVWAEQDPVDVGQINSNFQTIDSAHNSALQSLAALEARLPKLLLDVTTQSNAQQVDLDLSSIDLTEYDWIDVYLTQLPSGNTSGYPLGLRVNNISSKDYVMSNRDSYQDAFYGLRTQNDETNVYTLRFYCGTGAPFTGVLTDVLGRHILAAYSQSALAVAVAPSEVQSLNFFGTDTRYHVPAGCRFRVLGVKIC